MSLFLIRLIVITLFTLLFIFVIIKPDPVLAVLLAYVFEYILEPVLVLKIIRNQ